MKTVYFDWRWMLVAIWFGVLLGLLLARANAQTITVEAWTNNPNVTLTVTVTPQYGQLVELHAELDQFGGEPLYRVIMKPDTSKRGRGYWLVRYTLSADDIRLHAGEEVVFTIRNDRQAAGVLLDDGRILSDNRLYAPVARGMYEVQND